MRGGQTFNIAWPRRLTSLLEAAAVLSIWLMSRSYRGIVHDSRIYIGRALANLDPQGLGREPTFLYDEQTNHTIFSHLITPLVRAFGPSATSIGVTLVALLTWLAAAAWLARRLMPRRMVAAALVSAALLHAFYGPLDIFSFGEALATPRGLAEAAVMAGLAAMVGGRPMSCGGFLLVAALFHPIMAAAGLGVMFLLLAQGNRRWWGLAPLGVIGLLVAGALHLGPAKALLTVYDPDWLRVMHLRNGFMFLTDWRPSAWYNAARSALTLVLAAMILGGRRRALVVAALIVAAASLTASFLFGDLLGSMLILQLQLWRALWIVQVLAVLLIPVCAFELWTTRRNDARLAVVLLSVSWFEFAGALWEMPLLAIALGCTVATVRGGSDRVSRRAQLSVATAAIAVILISWGVSARDALQLSGTLATVGITLPLAFLLRLKLHILPIVGVMLAPFLFPKRMTPTVILIGLALTVVVLGPLIAIIWDQRTAAQRMIDEGQGRAELNRLIGPKTGTGIVWLPDDEVWMQDDVAPWTLLSRATWVADLQGTAGTFSRSLAMDWDARSADLIASGLGSIKNRDPWAESPPRRLNEAQIRDGALRLCAVKNGPQAIVLTGDLTKRFAPNVAAVWRAPAKDVIVEPRASDVKLTSVDLYTVVRCDRIPSSVDHKARLAPV